MKKIMFMMAVAMAFTVAHADQKNMEKGVHPCAPIIQACEAGGYTKGMAKQDKGLYKNCMDPIFANGAAPAGVNISAVTPAQLLACKSHHEKRKEVRERKEDHKKMKQEKIEQKRNKEGNLEPKERAETTGGKDATP